MQIQSPSFSGLYVDNVIKHVDAAYLYVSNQNYILEFYVWVT